MELSSIGVEEARRILWEQISPGPVVRLPLQDALGRILAEDLTSDLDFPPFDRMAMDGYAVRARDVEGARPERPVRLEVIGAAWAGRVVPGRVEAGQAVRAMTGAPLPDGCDAVVPVEDTDGWDDRVAVIRRPVSAGDHIAPRGEDLRSGERVLAAGTHLASQHVHALAASGHAKVPVFSPPSAAVLSTGDELVGLDEVPGPGQIRGSNGPCVIASLAEWGIPCHDLGVARDERAELRRALQDALSRYELVVTSGGISMGEKDQVKSVLEELGVRLHFSGLHLKPGHPATFGTHRQGMVFALPGNPVSVYVTLRAVFGAGLRRRLGHPRPHPPAEYGILDFDHVRTSKRPTYLPVTLEVSDEAALPRLGATGYRGSGDFTHLGRAGALAWLDGERREWPRGTAVEILRLDLSPLA